MIKPFAAITSQHFKGVLFISRGIAVLSVVIFVIGCLGAVMQMFGGTFVSTVAMIPIFVSSASLFLFAGLIAILVSIEEHLRVASEMKNMGEKR